MKRASIIVVFLTLIAIPGLAAEFSTNPNATPWRVDFPQAERALTTITHSATQSIVGTNSVSCNAGGFHADNSYLRRFDLLAFGITDQFDVTEVEVGVETAASSTGTDQPIEIRLYSIAAADPLVWANMTLLNTSVTTVLDTATGTVVAFPVTGSIVDPAVDHLVVEVFTPDGQATGESFFIGSNPDGQTDPSYIAAASCGITEPTDTAAIGFAGMHIVMNVTGDVLPVELMAFTIE